MNGKCLDDLSLCLLTGVMYILGISAYSHESSCALLCDGKIVAMAEEERFNREKHTSAFPKQAIEFCLRQAGISLEQVEHITFFWCPQRELTGNFSHIAKFFPESLQLLFAGSGGSEQSALKRIIKMLMLGKELQTEFQLSKKPKIHFIEHHVAHAASAYYASPFAEAAILTVDGRGESVSTMLSHGHGAAIEKIREISVPHSLGHFYAAVTEYLGFRPFFDEWKVMGLSAYGAPTYQNDFKDILLLQEDGSYQLNLDYFRFHVRGASQWLSPLFYEKFGPHFSPEGVIEQRAADIAYALQESIEKAGVHLARALRASTGSKNLCLAGGVALNCLMNKKIIEQAGFETVFIQPIANDAGASLGSALAYYYQLEKSRESALEHVYWGPAYSDEEIEKVLRERGVHFYKSESIAAEAARAIYEGKIVGWFQGRMESGPRALGNRSILADPTDPAMKERLNLRVKRRENFRPFAPSVLAECASEYFSLPHGVDSPYMILIGDVLESKRNVIPAVTHVDGTARVHTVERRINPLYHELITQFEKLSGVPIVLNTSFNENEPIVCAPQEAVDCFLRTDFDVLAIGNYLVKK